MGRVYVVSAKKMALYFLILFAIHRDLPCSTWTND